MQQIPKVPPDIKWLLLAAWQFNEIWTLWRGIPKSICYTKVNKSQICPEHQEQKIRSSYFCWQKTGSGQKGSWYTQIILHKRWQTPHYRHRAIVLCRNERWEHHHVREKRRISSRQHKKVPLKQRIFFPDNIIYLKKSVWEKKKKYFGDNRKNLDCTEY